MQFTFQDIFRSSFLENISAISFFDMVLAIALSFALGLFIFYIYKHCCTGVMYSAGFGATLIALCMITALLILAVTSNIVLSLGMVGALSIVRFRTAIKDPLDIAFLFWSIAAGIVLAAGFIPLAVFGSLFIGTILLFVSGRAISDRAYILVIHCQDQTSEKMALELLGDRVRRYRLKSKSVEPGLIELDIELRLKDEDTCFINELSELPGITHAVMVAYNGDYMG